MRVGLMSLGVLLTTVVGCSDPSAHIDFDYPEEGGPAEGRPGAVPMADACGDVRTTPLLYHGSSLPTKVPLSEGQMLALGWLEGAGRLCSAVLVSDWYVVTAAHCVADLEPGSSAPRFYVGPARTAALAALSVRRVVIHPDYDLCEAHDETCLRHPEADLALLELERAAKSTVPSIEPIPLLKENLGDSWMGKDLEVVGYGLTEDGSFGEREFAVMELTAFATDRFVVDAGGDRGVCSGDSGGPALALDGEGRVRVLGVANRAVSLGECREGVGIAVYTRLDEYRNWVVDVAGRGSTDAVATPGCGPVTDQGLCSGDSAVWCADGEVAAQDCGVGHSCGWDAASAGFRCIPDEVADPCDGVDSAGACEGDVARWCDRGMLRTRDCGMCGQTCARDARMGGVTCVATEY